MRFLSRPDGKGYLFAESDHYGLIQEINHQLVERAKVLDLDLKILVLHSQAGTTVAGQIEKAANKIKRPGGLVVMGLESWVRDGSDDVLTALNFSRERLNSLEVPMVFWIGRFTRTKLPQLAGDLFSQRAGTTIYFDEVGAQVPTDQGSLESQREPQIILKRDAKGLEVRIALLERQLKEAIAQNYSPNKIILEIKAPLAHALFEIGNYSRSLAISKEILDFFISRKDLQNIAISYSKLGTIYSAQGKYDLALEYYEKRKQLGEELYSSNPQSESLKNGLAISYEKLGTIYEAQGKYDLA